MSGSARDVERLGFRIYADAASTAEERDLLAIFHRWIQTGKLDEIVIDVADYSHVPSGPGVLLVCHDARYGIGHEEGRLALTYTRRQSASREAREGALPARLAFALGAALRASRLLESEPLLAGKLRFETTELLFQTNDRLLAPNDAETHAVLGAEIAELAGRLYGSHGHVARVSEVVADRYAVRVTSEVPATNVGALLERLA
jgi:hypothetical protein